MQVSTTRGLPFDPAAAKGYRKAELNRRLREIEQAYRQHTTGQVRYQRAQRKGR